MYRVRVRDDEAIILSHDLKGRWTAAGSPSAREGCHSSQWAPRERSRLIANLGGRHGDKSHVRKSAGEGSMGQVLATPHSSILRIRLSRNRSVRRLGPRP